MATAGNVIAVLEPLQIAAKLCGYSLFSVNHRSFAVQFRKIDRIAQVWTAFVNPFLIYFMWTSSDQLITHKSSIIRKGMSLALITCYILYVVCMLIFFLKRHKMAQLMQQFCRVDERV